jgi:hypothetical protein
MLRDVLKQIWDDVNKKYETDAKMPPQESKFTLDGRWDVSDVEDKAFKQFRKKHGLSK